MEGHIERSGDRDESFDRRTIDSAGSVERSDDDPGSAGLAGGDHVRDGQADLVILVDESARSRTHEHVDETLSPCRTRSSDRGSDQPRRRCQSADAERRAQFDPVGAGSERRPNARRVLHRDLHGNESFHRSPSTKQSSRHELPFPAGIEGSS